MTNENLEQIMKKAFEEEKREFKAVYCPLGKDEINRINSQCIEDSEEFVLPIEIIAEANSLIYEPIYVIRKNREGKIKKLLQIYYGTSDSKNLDFLQEVADFNERVALKLSCSLIRVESCYGNLSEIYSKRNYNFFSKGYQNFGFKSLKKK